MATGLIRYGAVLRLTAALSLAALLLLLMPESISSSTQFLVCWDAANMLYLLLAWFTMRRANAAVTRAHAISQDQSGYLIFLFVVVAAFAGMTAIGFMAGALKVLSGWAKLSHLALSVAALVSSWLLIQVVFAFHYARLFYAVKRPDNGHHTDTTPTSELLFPGDQAPDYLDFAYYSFVVGMTSQVSDVQVTSRRMRHLTLVHSILAFIFNIGVVALSINIIASAI